MKRSVPRSIAVPSARPALRSRASDLRFAKDVLGAVAFAAGLFSLIALLDGAATPDDRSPGAAVAATLPPVARQRPDALEIWRPDTSAEGTRPDAVH